LPPSSPAVTVVDSGRGALDILRRSTPGTFQLILTVSAVFRYAHTPLVTSTSQQHQPCVVGCVSSAHERRPTLDVHSSAVAGAAQPLRRYRADTVLACCCCPVSCTCRT
jgi:hypothetical protein